MSSIGKDVMFNDGNIDWRNAGINAVIGGISGAGADNIISGAHVTKYVNSRNILNKTVINGTKKAIANQTNVMNMHAGQLAISATRYLASNMFSVLMSQV